MTDVMKVGLIVYGMSGQVFHAPVIEAVPQLKLVKDIRTPSTLSTHFVLRVFQNRRWDGDFLTVQKVLDGKLLGRVVENGVTADFRKQREVSKVDDNFEILMQYPGLKVTLKAGMLVKIPGPRYIVQGTEGTFHKHGIDPQEDALKMGRTPAEFGWGVSSKEDRGHLVTRTANLEIDARVETLPGSYQEYYSNIADAIRGRKELAVKPVTAMNTVRIIELAMESKC
ncbi:hypothetical protein R1flu_016589 [Riccia fluitans]|uniref:Gfo/Idh/MocA-like oxidoreductase C-terminal domain-containing protein n=1 Tax=Riccia fluitans TaxID=41844 RepID=A0ABD1YMH3_9MARC